MKSITYSKITLALNNLDEDVNQAIEFLPKFANPDKLSELYSTYSELVENYDEHYRENQANHNENIQYIYDILNNLAECTEYLSHNEFLIDGSYPADDCSIGHRRDLFLEAFHYRVDKSSVDTSAGASIYKDYNQIEDLIKFRNLFDSFASKVSKTTSYIEAHQESEKSRNLELILGEHTKEELESISIIYDKLDELSKILKVSTVLVDVPIPKSPLTYKGYCAFVYNKDI